MRIVRTLIRAKDELKWLVILFDRKLNFKEKVQTACQRPRVVIDHIQRLCNTSCGAPPGPLRQAIQGYAFATLLYDAET